MQSQVATRTRYPSLTKYAMALREPTVRIRELGRDHVNFVLENVDLAYVFQSHAI